MAIIFKPRKSTLAGAVPTTSQLQDGELAINTTDKKIFVRVGAAIVEIFKSLTKADVGLSNVDNTSDLAKPVSTATATALAGKANTTHNHSISNVTGLQTALDGKSGTEHTHAIGDVSGLQSALDGKQAAGSYAPASHSHTIANVSGLQTALDGKQAAGSYAAASHTHSIANVSGLQGALDAKANSNSASFTNSVNIGGAVDLSVQLNPTGGRSVRFAATSTPDTGLYDATNNAWLFRIDVSNHAHIAGNANINGGSARVQGYGGDNTKGVLYLGNGEQYIFGRGTDIEFCSNGRYATLSSGGTLWTSENVTPIDTNANPRLGWNCANVTDWNEATNNGWHMGSGALNAPTGAWLMGLVTVHNGDWVTQEVWEFANSTSSPRRWKRHKQAGTWKSWLNVGEIIVSATDPGGMDGTIWVQP